MICDLIIMLFFIYIFMHIISMFVVWTTLNLSDIGQI
jgi:hypothetical protein